MSALPYSGTWNSGSADTPAGARSMAAIAAASECIRNRALRSIAFIEPPVCAVPRSAREARASGVVAAVHLHVTVDAGASEHLVGAQIRRQVVGCSWCSDGTASGGTAGRGT